MDISNATKLYLNSLPKPLTKEETDELFKRFKENGDMDARDTIIRHNLKLALGIVFDRFSNAPMDFDDTLQVATMALVTATDTYSPDKNVNFSTYATNCITNNTLKEINKRNKMLEISALSLNSKPVADELEEQGASCQSYIDLRPDEDESHIALDYQKKIFYQKLEKLIESELTKEEKFVYNALTGRGHERPLLLREIAAALHITHPMVIYIKHNIENKIYKNLKGDYVSLDTPVEYFD